MSQENLQEQFLQSKDQHERVKTQEDIDDQGENIQKRSKLIVFISDALDEFENRNRSTAGCLYAIFVSFLLALLTSIHTNSSQVPVLEIVFVSSLIMFIANFHFITNSNILPYIEDEKLNTTVKKAGISTLLSVVLLVASLQNNTPSIGVFFYLSSWAISFLFETYINHQIFDHQELFMGLIAWGGLAFALDIPYILLTHPLTLINQNVLLAILGGIFLVYSGETLRQLKDQNIFTITHVVSLLVIIFLPLFFPVEGLKSPSFIDWLFFLVVAFIFFIFFPVVIRSFSLEKQTLIILFLSWVIPFHMGFNFLLRGYLPNIFNIAGAGAIIFATLILLSFQKVKIHQGSFYIQREKDDPFRPKNDVEMNLWTSRYQ